MSDGHTTIAALLTGAVGPGILLLVASWMNALWHPTSPGAQDVGSSSVGRDYDPPSPESIWALGGHDGGYREYHVESDPQFWPTVISDGYSTREVGPYETTYDYNPYCTDDDYV